MSVHLPEKSGKRTDTWDPAPDAFWAGVGERATTSTHTSGPSPVDAQTPDPPDTFLDILPYNQRHSIDRDTSTPDQLQGGWAIDCELNQPEGEGDHPRAA